MPPITLRFPKINEELLSYGPADLEILQASVAADPEEPVEIHCTAEQALEMLRYL